MYDKYLRGNTVATDTVLSKMKGMLIAGIGNASFYIVNDAGNTIGITLGFSGGIDILPMQIHTLRPHPSGLTALYLN